MKNMLRDKVLVEQPAGHPDCITKAPFVQRTLMIGKVRLFPRAFGVTHHEEGFGHGGTGGAEKTG